jgi:predicted translin family RNA/ssDNA-binding protein
MSGPDSTEPPGSGGAGFAGAGAGNSADASLQRAEELLERLRVKLDELERLAETGDADAAVDDLTEIAEIAKEIEGEIGRARTRADAGS